MTHKKNPLSAFIISLNEADRIASTLESIKNIADEIVVVDSGSTDDTISIAKSYGAKVIHRDWEGYASQKSFAAKQCTHDWCLNIDADEFLTPELQTEISRLLHTEAPEFDAYNVGVVTLFPGEERPCRFPHSYNIPRLYKRSAGHILNTVNSVDDRIYLNDKNAKFGQLNADIWHRSIRNLSLLIAKQNKYTDDQIQHNIDKGRNFSTTRLILEFPLSLFKLLFIKGHILRGWYGFAIALTGAYMRFLRVAKTKEAFRVKKH